LRKKKRNKGRVSIRELKRRNKDDLNRDEEYKEKGDKMKIEKREKRIKKTRGSREKKKRQVSKR
jgi:hypothetical protein